MAAHIEGKGAALIDMVGISQKNGAVVTHLKIAAKPEDISAVRVARGHADLILGCDLVTSASERILQRGLARQDAGGGEQPRDRCPRISPMMRISMCRAAP